MNILPHLVVLHHIKDYLMFLKDRPDYLEFILSGYKINCSVTDVYGPRQIASVIRWIQENIEKFHFVFGYRLDLSNTPSVSVMFEGATEGKQMVGDYGSIFTAPRNPQKYKEFHASSIDKDGNMVVSADYHLEDYLWRKQVLVRESETRIITDLIKISDTAPLIIVPDIPFAADTHLDSWSVYSASSAQLYTVGTSLDKIKVSVYMDIPGEPELSEALSCVMRSILKRSRLILSEYGLNNITFSYNSLARNSSYEPQAVWTSEYTLTAEMTDQWIVADTTPPDNFSITLFAKGTQPNEEEVEL